MAVDWNDFHLSVSRGDVAYFDFTVSLAGVAQNISGWGLTFLAKRRVGDADGAAVISKTLAGGGITVVSASAGTAYVTITGSDTTPLSLAGETLFAFTRGMDPMGNSYTLDRGKLLVLPE